MIVELFGLPGSGKTFLKNELASHLADKIKTVGRSEAVKLCLQRRNDGPLTSLFKKLPYTVWNRIIHKHYCLSEFLDFSSRHIKLISLYQKALSESGVSEQVIRIILGAFVNTCVERQLFERYGCDDELILMDEGFCHRFFTLYGNLGISCDQKNIIRYVDLLPFFQGTIFIATPENLCMERLERRSNLPVLLKLFNGKKIMKKLNHGIMLFEKLTDELDNHNIPCYRYDGQSSDFKAVANFCTSII